MCKKTTIAILAHFSLHIWLYYQLMITCIHLVQIRCTNGWALVKWVFLCQFGLKQEHPRDVVDPPYLGIFYIALFHENKLSLSCLDKLSTINAIFGLFIILNQIDIGRLISLIPTINLDQINACYHYLINIGPYM